MSNEVLLEEGNERRIVHQVLKVRGPTISNHAHHAHHHTPHARHLHGVLLALQNTVVHRVHEGRALGCFDHFAVCNGEEMNQRAVGQTAHRIEPLDGLEQGAVVL